jgi:exodeoxyribonuclease V alpha subunit
MMFCKDFMGASDITKVYKSFGAGAVGIIQDNPYILCNSEFGISFEKADAIAKSLGAAADSASRIYSGMRYILS